jgi:hypothetical protein
MWSAIPDLVQFADGVIRSGMPECATSSLSWAMANYVVKVLKVGRLDEGGRTTIVFEQFHR